jgi:alpha-tubulin suppressor-like RCC1 family protein
MDWTLVSPRESIIIAAGYSHSLALLEDGTVRAWGFNGTGQLGDGTTTYSLTPVQVKGF